MALSVQEPSISKPILWIARILGAVAVLFFLFDGVSHLLRPAPVVEAFTRLAFPIGLAPLLGVIQIALLVLYLIPATRVLGAVLITGYLGGAIAVNMRVGDPAFETLFPIILGVLFWAPPYLTDPKLRALFSPSAPMR